MVLSELKSPGMRAELIEYLQAQHANIFEGTSFENLSPKSICRTTYYNRRKRQVIIPINNEETTLRNRRI